MLAKESRSWFAWIWASFLGTQVFWALFSLLNFAFLMPLAFAPSLLLWWPHPRKFVPFLSGPVCFGAAITVLVGMLLHFAVRGIWKLRGAKHVLPLLFNAVFLIAFLGAADWSLRQEIAAALVGRTPDCVAVQPFFDSLLAAGVDFREPHAIVVQGDTRMIWSYSDMEFVEAGDRLSFTLSCR